MTIINPNSISGISSITALNSTAAINLFKSDGTAANIIAGVTTGANFKTGTSNVHSTGYECTNINASGIITATTFKGDGDFVELDVDGHTNLDNVSIAGVSTFTGNADFSSGVDITGTLNVAGAIDSTVAGADNTLIIETTSSGDPKLQFNAAGSGGHRIEYSRSTNILSFTNGTSNRLQINAAGHTIPGTDSLYDLGLTGTRWRNVYADTLYGSGANLTSLPAQATIANNANNRVITGGSGVNLNGEANLTFDGSTLSVGGNISMGDSNRIYIGGSNDAYIYHDTANTHFVNGTGHLQIRQTANSDVITQTNGIDRVRIYNDGLVAIGQSSKSSTAGAGNLDIQGNATSCIIEMGNPFPTFSGGVVPEFRITATNSSHTVDFASVWGGDNLLHKHLSFSGGVTAFYKGTTSDEVARFNQNNFGVGTQSPGQLIHTHSGSSSGGLAIQSNGSTNYIAAIQTANNFITGSTAGGLAIRSGNGIEFSGNDGSAVQMRLNSSGNLELTGNVVLSNAASGRGIDFSASANASNASASMSSELFDDYEEGSFTPTDVSGHGITITNNNPAQYTKIGRFVHVTFDCTWAGGHSGGGNAAISLPFAMGEEYGSGSVGWNQVNKPLQIHVNSAGAQIMENYSNGSGGRHLSNNSISGNRIIGDCSYFTGT